MPFSNGSLFVRKAKKSYEGDYYCTAVNSGGYESTDISVKVGGKNIEIEATFSRSHLIKLTLRKFER